MRNLVDDDEPAQPRVDVVETFFQKHSVSTFILIRILVEIASQKKGVLLVDLGVFFLIVLEVIEVDRRSSAPHIVSRTPGIFSQSFYFFVIESFNQGERPLFELIRLDLIVLEIHFGVFEDVLEGRGLPDRKVQIQGEVGLLAFQVFDGVEPNVSGDVYLSILVGKARQTVQEM